MGKMIFFVSTKDFVYWFELFSLDEVHDRKQIVVIIIINRFRILDFYKSFPSNNTNNNTNACIGKTASSNTKKVIIFVFIVY